MQLDQHQPLAHTPPMCTLVCMRTNIALDEALIARAKKLTGIKTKKELVHEALRTLIRLRERRSLLELDGKVRFAPNYDYKRLRERGA